MREPDGESDRKRALGREQTSERGFMRAGAVDTVLVVFGTMVIGLATAALTAILEGPPETCSVANAGAGRIQAALADRGCAREPEQQPAWLGEVRRIGMLTGHDGLRERG